MLDYNDELTRNSCNESLDRKPPNREDWGYPCTGEDKMKVAGTELGGIGTGLGVLIGAAIGHREVLTF